MVGHVGSEQEQLLDEALQVVKHQSFYMKRCLDKHKLMDGLKHASTMLGELRSSALSPRSYYELYVQICDELRYLEDYLLDEFQKGRKVADLYELVQYAGNIVPRLYLLITVGLIYIKTNEFSRKHILKDLVEMCRGVQHPLRGLFLRNYLLQCTKNVLPGSELATVECLDGTVMESIDFILSNFAEMNKLWVRMQHQGHSREKEKRESERMELRILVGTNLVRLSQLETLDKALYSKVVLPGILEQVLSCRDPIAQEYLMECIVQVFPTEFHLATMSSFLQACSQLHPAVNIKTIIKSIIDRIAQGMAEVKANEVSEEEIFDTFLHEISNLANQRKSLPPEDVIAMQNSLLLLSSKLFPGSQKFDIVLAKTKEQLISAELQRIEIRSPIGQELEKMFEALFSCIEDTRTVLDLRNFFGLTELFDREGKSAVAKVIMKSVIENEIQISEMNHVENLMGFLSDFLDSQGIPNENAAEEQELVSRFLHFFYSSDLLRQMEIIEMLKKNLLVKEKVYTYTLVPFFFNCLRFVQRIGKECQNATEADKLLNNIYTLCREIISVFTKTRATELAIRLTMECAESLNRVKFENQELLAYEFMTEAFSLFEEEVSESRHQVVFLNYFIGSLCQMSVFSQENHHPLRTQCTLASTKLLKKSDQCRLLMDCTDLFWNCLVTEGSGFSKVQDEKRVLDCLNKCIKISNQCIDKTTKVQLQIEILQKLLILQRKHFNPAADLITNLEESIKKEMGDQVDEEMAQNRKHFQNVMAIVDN